MSKIRELVEQREFGGGDEKDEDGLRLTDSPSVAPNGQFWVSSAIAKRLARLHANHKRIAAGALTIAALTIVAKALVAVREMSIAWRYGISGTVDAYQLSLTIVIWLPMLVSSVLGVVLVPRLVALRRRDDAQQGFVSELNGSVLALGTIIAIATYFSAPTAAELMASRLDPETLRLTTWMVQRLSPVSLFIVVGGYFTTRLQARERFSYTVTEAIPALTIATLVLGPFPARSAIPLIAGALIGYLGQVAILSRLVAIGDPPFGKISLKHRSREWESLYHSILMMALGQLVLTATNPIDQAFAARLGQGSVATLGYANRIIILFTGLASVGVGRALLPVLSKAVADGDLKLGRRQVIQWAWLLFAAAVVASFILWAVAPEMISLLFQRGAFKPDATVAVASVVRFGLIQLPFYFGGIALVQWIAAKGAYSALLWIACGALFVKLSLNFVLVPKLGLEGLMLGTAAMYGVSFLMQLHVSRRS